MGPNLTKLFEEATPGTLIRVPDTANVYAKNEQGYNRISFLVMAEDHSVTITECRRTAALITLLANHGRALVEALEHNLAAMRWTRDNMPLEWGRAVNSELMNAWDETKQLLAQLETEAQG